MHRNDRNDADLARDAAGIGPHARPGLRLTPLGELKNFDVAAGDADVRGWEVRTVSGRELGKVEELLVDATAGEVVMLDIDLHGTDRNTLAPVRAAQIDRVRRVVVLDTSDLQDAAALPSLRRNAAPTEDEARQFHEGYQRVYGARGFDRDRDVQVSRGDHDVEFRRRYAETDRTAAAGLGAGAAAGADAAGRDAVTRHQDEVLADQTRRDAARREIERQQGEQRERIEHERQQGAQSAQSGAGRELRWAQGQQPEEVVVERRPVIEEVVIRRRVVDPSELQQAQGAQGAQGSGAADRATSSGPMDQLADKADDVKDRFDGNPASRPGPDATDRRI